MRKHKPKKQSYNTNTLGGYDDNYLYQVNKGNGMLQPRDTELYTQRNDQKDNDQRVKKTESYLNESYYKRGLLLTIIV